MQSYSESISRLLRSKEPEQLHLRKSMTLLMVLWTVVIAFSLSWNVWSKYSGIEAIAENTARGAFKKDQAFRFWAASHGGVYVPADERTPSNPNLSHIPDRDIVRPDGTQLTVMNPAYMIRQMMQEYSGLYGAKSKITSLKYLYEGNRPDAWETKALKAFEKGTKEAYAFTQIDDEPYLRLMQPMYIKESCLKCHAVQGYRLGDVRGGVGVSVPLQPLYAIAIRHVYVMIFGHVVIWMMVLGGIVLFTLRESGRLEEKIVTVHLLKESEKRFRELIENIGIGIVVYEAVDEGKDFIIRNFNKSAEEIDAVKREDVIGRRVTDAFPGVDSFGLLEVFERVWQSGEYEEYPMALYTDERLYGWRENYIYRLSSGEIVALYEDKTEEKQLLDSVEFNKHYLQSLFDVNPNILIATDGEMIDKANPAMLEFTGFKSLDAFKAEHDCICDLFLACDGCLLSQMQGISWLEYILQDPTLIHKVHMMRQGKKYHFLAWAKPLELDERKRSLVIFTDITELERAYEALQEKEQIMIAQSRHAAMGEMIGMIAHQWRQPISVVAMGANNLLADIDLELLSEEGVREQVKSILKQTDYLSKTIDDFRDFFRPNKKMEEVQLEAVMDEAKKIIGKSLENSGIALSIKNENGYKIKTYSRELLQVYINLLKNAKEALVESTPNNRHIEVMFSHDEADLITTVCDNGGGIDEEIIGKVFDPYFSTKDEKTGTGLGLYMSKTIIEKHLHGTITVANSGEGTCFTVSIPIKGEG